MSRPDRPREAFQAVDPEDHARTLARESAALDDARRAFLRTVSHELRTPLNAIIGFSEILTGELYGPLGAPQYREYAEHVRQSGYRLLRLVNQVLEVAGLSGKAIDLSLEPQPLDHVLDDVRDRLREDLRATGARIVVHDADRLPAVLADAKGLRTLLFNLMQNALLHGGAAGLVEVLVRRHGDRVEIEVRDHGDGVDQADLPRLLAPFELGQDAQIKTSRGAGLGLPIARLLAESMNGHLTLSSAPGHGLSAVATLPVA